MIASLSPVALPFITSSRSLMTTTSATSGVAIETRVIAADVVSGNDRPVGRSTRTTFASWARSAGAASATSVAA